MKDLTRFAITLLLVFACPAAFAQSQMTTVLLVRHAEKTAEPKDDPVLTAEGQKRAATLLRMTRAAGVNAIYTSQYARTRLTAEPLSKELKVPITTVDADKSKDLATEILTKHRGKVVLVVGHSNTLGEIIQELGGDPIPEIPDDEYNNFYVVAIAEAKQVKVLQLKFD